MQASNDAQCMHMTSQVSSNFKTKTFHALVDCPFAVPSESVPLCSKMKHKFARSSSTSEKAARMPRQATDDTFCGPIH